MTSPGQGGDSLAAHRFGVQLGGVTVESVQEVSGLTFNQDVVEVAGVTSTGQPFVKKQPGASKGGQVTITRGMDTSSAFSQWVQQTMEEGAVTAARQNLTIEIMDTTGGTRQRIDLFNAWASNYTGPSLSAGQASGATEQITIEFETAKFYSSS
jgi:phage tail-like protein